MSRRERSRWVKFLFVIFTHTTLYLVNEAGGLLAGLVFVLVQGGLHDDVGGHKGGHAKGGDRTAHDGHDEAAEDGAVGGPFDLFFNGWRGHWN